MTRRSASAVLVGCVPILPSRPLALQLISVTAVDERLLTSEGDIEDAVQVAPEESVDLRSTFAGLPVLESNDISLSSLDGTITVFLVMAGPEMRTEMVFENIDVSALEEGSFVSSSGEVSDSPCDMPRD